MAGQWQGRHQPQPVIKVRVPSPPSHSFGPKPGANRGARPSQSTRLGSFPRTAPPLCYSPSFVVVVGPFAQPRLPASAHPSPFFRST